MSESSTFQPIRNLIELCWPGEWGSDPIGDRSNCVVFRATDIDNDGHLNLEGGAARDVLPLKIKSKALRRNDILLEASGGAPDKPVGRVALVASDPSRPSLTSNFFRFVRPTSGVDARYLMLQLIALNRSSAIWRYQQQTTGLINLKVNDYLDHKILVPTLPVQQKISDIIFGIDKAIEKTEALIAKYQQIKAGLMHDLFTRGVTADGKLRPPREQAPELYQETPIGWIPKEWEVRPFRSVLTGNLQNGYFKKPELVGTGYKLVNVSELYQPFGIDTDHPNVERVAATSADFHKFGVQEGDLFFTRSSLVLSGIAQCNTVLKLMEPTLFECHVIRGKPDKNIVNPAFLGLYFQTPGARRELMSRAKQTTMTTIS